MHEPYRRRLPHIMPPGETLFITYRLHGTIPRSILIKFQTEYEQYVAQQIANHSEESDAIIKQRWQARYFLTIDKFLDTTTKGSNWLTDNHIAEIVKEAIHFRDKSQFDLHAYCVMPNHVHILITNDCSDAPFYRVLGSLKAISAKKANAYLERTGQPFWQGESYDHAVRNEKSFERIISYILNNPVKAGLVANWQDWPHSYCRYDW